MSAITEEVILDSEKEYEVVDGQPEEKTMGGAKHGGVGVRLIVRLGGHVEASRLGGVYGPDTLFHIGRNSRMPDVAFVAAARIPEEGEPEGTWELAPDLAVEIISPSDLWDKVISKVEEYFAAGVRQVWLISPTYRTLTVYHAPTRTTILTEADELQSDDIVPGFRLKIGELFQSPARP
ncbi:MAG TPA: Uma2 family endonuclease [Blastocatellia bacterium]|nr:Uma2 family endonuclease [Blastocatellia bacterium]